MTDAKIVPFLFEGEGLVRVVDREGAPWFVAADVCKAVGIQQATRAVEPLDDDERGVSSIHTLGGNQELLIISEGGLYTLILRSRDATKPGTVAHRFRKWVTAEVLPALRKSGGYTIPGTDTEAPPDLEPKPWAQRPLEERNAELRTVGAIGRYGNHALAWWYLAEVAHVADFPHQLLPAWHQEQLNLQPPPREIIVSTRLN